MKGMFKKLPVVLTAAVLLLSLLPLSALAEWSDDYDYTYEVSNGKATITGYYGSGGAVTIPSKLGGYPVTGIEDYAFSGSNLTSVTIPGGVTSIGRGVFSYCLHLAAINVASSNTKYSSLNGILFDKIKIKLIQYPAGKTSASYTMPSSVTNIGESAFSYCFSLTGVTVPGGLITIGDFAFIGCSELGNITIPNSVTNIGQNVFGGCAKLATIIVASSNTKYTSQNGVLFNKAKTVLKQYPGGKAGSSYTIPNGVISIDAGAFSGCAKLASVAIPNSVINIGEGAFAGCIGLVSITIPSSVTSIAGWAFSGCTNLTSIIIPGKVASIGEAAFSGCTKLVNVTISGSVTSIGKGAFDGCNKLAAINVASSNAKYASQNGVLFSKSKAKLIKYPEGKTGMTYSIPSSVLSIGDGAFSYCVGLASVTIPGSVRSIGEGAFSNCTKLENLTISSGVSSIGVYAFSSCDSLTSVTIPGSVTSIGAAAFIDCSKLAKAVFLGNAPTMCDAIAEASGEAVFGYNPNFNIYYIKGKTGFTNPWHGYPTVSITPPSAPTSVKAASFGYTSVKLTWAAVAGATKYEVWRATTSGGTFYKLPDTATPSCTNTGLITGKTYYYKVRAYRTVGTAKVYSGYSAVVSAKPMLSTPTGVNAARASATSIKVSWNAVAGATKYEVWRATSSGGTFYKLPDTTALSYTNTGLTTGKTYYYKVRAYRLVGDTKVYGGYSAVVSAKP